MSEKKEMRLDNSELVLKNNIVKSGILPQRSKELSRDIRVQQNVTVEGGVYGNRITVEGGNAIFKGAVFASKELFVNHDVTGQVYFQKAVASADTIVSFVKSGRTIFGADVNAQTIRLKNTFVGGSVFANDIYLENCVVLGGVFATKAATIVNSMVGTFYSPYATMSGTNYLLYPACFSVEPISCLPNTELYNLSLAHLGALFKGEKEDEKTGKIKMDFNNDSQRTVLVDDDDVQTIVNSYSVSGRVLAADLIDMEKLENHFLIEAGSLGSQLIKSYTLSRQDGTRSAELSVSNIAEFLFSILLGKTNVQTLDAEISFKEFKEALR